MGGRRANHLTPGYCWRADDGSGMTSVWGIYGHHEDDAAREIARAYEGDDDASAGQVPDDAAVTRDYRRAVPCRRASCEYDCSGSHLELAGGPGPGASPYTWVEA